MIRDYFLDEDEPDFQYFKKKNIASWGSIQQIIQEIEKLLKKYQNITVFLSSAALKKKAKENLEYY